MYASKRRVSSPHAAIYKIRSILRNLPILALAALVFDLPAMASGEQSQPAPASPASISGSIVDRTGASITGAKIRLSHKNDSPVQEGISGNDGQFSFDHVEPGPFQITIAAQGFAAKSLSGTAQAGQTFNFPPTVLEVATLTTDVQVTLSPAEIAQEQVRAEEKQRLLGLVPNYFVSYAHQAPPLTTKLKFSLALKSTVDPFTFVVNAVIAGVQQSQNDYAGFGQGAQGYAKRYGASYGTFFTGTLLGGAILPSLFKQDPRYFVKGYGTKRSRALYAIANAFVRKGDNGHWQPDYSGILGSLAAAGISNFYYPNKNRNSAAVTFENTAIGIGADTLGYLFQEFFSRKLTPSANKRGASKP